MKALEKWALGGLAVAAFLYVFITVGESWRVPVLSAWTDRLTGRA